MTEPAESNRNRDSEGRSQKAGTYGCPLAPHCLSRMQVSEFSCESIFSLRSIVEPTRLAELPGVRQ